MRVMNTGRLRVYRTRFEEVSFFSRSLSWCSPDMREPNFFQYSGLRDPLIHGYCNPTYPNINLLTKSA